MLIGLNFMFETMDICVRTIQRAELTCNGQVTAVRALRNHLMEETGIEVCTYTPRIYKLEGSVLKYGRPSVNLEEHGDLHVLGHMACALRTCMGDDLQPGF
eukprot:GHVU01130993.1.p2 GENE.GHVU01130993.1~~GHVU01130993.1.p2  ORF type:complete len:101 (-),score=5.98 GHVU01130993.1:84-386(-)